MLLRLAGRVRQLDGLRARTARVGAAVGNDVLELDAIVLLPHLAAPHPPAMPSYRHRNAPTLLWRR